MLAGHPKAVGDDNPVEGGWRGDGFAVDLRGVEGGGTPDEAINGDWCDRRGCSVRMLGLVRIRPGLDIGLHVLLDCVCRQSWTGWVVCDRDRVCAAECADD